MTDHPQPAAGEAPQLHLSTGNDAMNQLLSIFFSGFLSGATSALSTFAGDVDQDEIDRIGQQITTSLTDDPLGVEVARNEIIELLTGTDSGPKAWTIGRDRG